MKLLRYMVIRERNENGRNAVSVCHADWKSGGYYTAGAAHIKRSGSNCGRGYTQ